MSLETVMGSDLRSLFFDENGSAEPADVDGMELFVLRTPVVEAAGGGDEPDRRSMTMFVHADDLARPALGQTLTIDGAGWIVGELETSCNVHAVKLYDELPTLVAYQVEGLAVTLTRPDGVEVPARIILERAGLQHDGREERQQAVVKVLRAEFVQPPEGRFEADGLVWRLGELLGRADGTNRFQWAVLAVADTRVGVGK